jgi:ubiquinone/menaquinone biosynthesis C-methylase UbiE
VTEIANRDQFEAWNGDSGRRWVADPERRDRVIAEVGEMLLGAARPVPGERVLDVGCGCGATTLAAARRVRPRGAAVGVDLSAPMLAVARDRARAEAAANANFEQGDAQTFVFDAATFDVAISRFGTMFFADPTAAFVNIARALRNRGRLCIATWQPLAMNDWLTIPGAALLSFGSMPDERGGTGGPGMFAQSDPAVIASTLTAAGFDGIDIVPVTPTLHLGATPADAAAHLAETGPGRAVLETIPEADRPRAIAAVEDALSSFVTRRGVELGGAVWLTSALVGNH